MTRIAITGGIGCGKSYVCRMLAERGISVYDCDAAAKRLMRTSVRLQCQLSDAVGREVFPGGILDKAVLSAFIVASEKNAQRIDAIVHPAVAKDFLDSGLQWLESAILFESGFHARVPFNHVICVTAPLEIRIARVMERDGICREKALAWISRQLPQEEKLALSDFEIVNDGTADVAVQIDGIISKTNIIKI